MSYENKYRTIVVDADKYAMVVDWLLSQGINPKAFATGNAVGTCMNYEEVLRDIEFDGCGEASLHAAKVLEDNKWWECEQ